MLRARHQSPLPAAALLLFAVALPPLVTSGTLLADDSSRSEAQTAGEKRLLDWDLKKTYDLSRSRTDSKSQAPSRSFSTQTFRPGGFQTKAFSTEAFASTEFLTPEGKNQTKPFSTKPAFPVNSPVLGKSFLPENAAPVPPKAVPTFAAKASSSPKEFAEAARPFQGPEAERKARKYGPGNAPTGGVVEGRRLSIDEVREILNKSK
jgi:hypothetical protein